MGTQEARTGRFKCSLKYSREKLPKSPRRPTTAVRVEWEYEDENTLKWVEQGREARKLIKDMSKRSHSVKEPKALTRRRRKKEKHEKNT